MSNCPRILFTSQVRPNHHKRAPLIMLRYPTDISNGWSGMTNENCANNTINRKIISGLRNVIQNAVTPLYISVPFLLPLMCIFLVGLLLKQYIPNSSNNVLPVIFRMNRYRGLVMKSITKLIPKPVISAYIISLMAAPTPVTNPYHRPLFNVLWIHNIPTGPIGADTKIPINIPLNIKSSMSMWKGNGISYAKLRILYDMDKFFVAKLCVVWVFLIPLPINDGVLKHPKYECFTVVFIMFVRTVSNTFITIN